MPSVLKQSTQKSRDFVYQARYLADKKQYSSAHRLPRCFTQPVIKPPASQVFEDEDTDEPGSTQLQIPEHLYMFIQQALDLQKQLQTSKTPDYLRSKLETVNLIIADYIQSYILSGSLPYDWK
ncbi:hypothetical protein Tco_1550088 [Tanacetum coccineum]